MANKNKYDWKKTAWKTAKVFIFGGIGGVVSWLSGLPLSPSILISIAVLTAIQNYYKVKVNGK